MKGAQLLNVAGIAPASEVNGVMIWRPLMGHGKEEIYAYAHEYGVPYFKDTTPAWSTCAATSPLLEGHDARTWGYTVKMPWVTSVTCDCRAAGFQPHTTLPERPVPRRSTSSAHQLISDPCLAARQARQAAQSAHATAPRGLRRGLRPRADGIGARVVAVPNARAAAAARPPLASRASLAARDLGRSRALRAGEPSPQADCA